MNTKMYRCFNSVDISFNADFDSRLASKKTMKTYRWTGADELQFALSVKSPTLAFITSHQPRKPRSSTAEQAVIATVKTIVIAVSSINQLQHTLQWHSSYIHYCKSYSSVATISDYNQRLIETTFNQVLI